MSPETTQDQRPYRKRRRAEAEQRTRLRITEAAVKLHATVGPARTTVSAIAKEAGVQRATVYRHFPSEEELFQACSAHWAAGNPPPDADAWRQVAKPEERLRRALTELYAWYRTVEDMLERTGRDAPFVEAMAGPREAFLDYFRVASEIITAGRRERGGAARRVAAAVGHAVAFPTWQSLVREQGLGDGEAVALMAAMVEAAGRARP